MKLRFLFGFFIAVMLPYYLFANVAGVISGTITDAKTGGNLAGAVITISQLRLSTVADASGQFSFSALPSKGRYVVEARYAGYKTQIKTIDLASGGALNFALERSIVEIKEVVITGTPITSSNKSNSTSASSVSREDLLTPSTNLIDALARQVPGMGQITTGGAISKPVIRGLSYNRVVTLTNGVKQQGQQWGDEHGIEIDQNQADRVEVLRGAASLLYGSDAIGGVVNVLDPLVPSPGKIKGELLNSYATNNGLTNTSLMLSGNGNGFVWRGRGSYQSARDFKTPAGYYINSGFNNTSLSGMLGLNKQWGYSHLNLSYFKNNIGFHEAEPGDALYTDKAVGRTLDFPRQDIRHYKLASNNNFIIGNNTLKLDLGYQKNQRRELESADPALFFDLNTFSGDAKYYLGEANGWQPIIGLSASNESSRNKGYEYLIPEYDQTSAGTFIYIKKSWDKSTFNAGLRYDYVNNDGKQLFVNGAEQFAGFKNRFTNMSGAVGYTHSFSEGLTLKANAGSAFRAPNPAELGSNGAHEGTVRFEIGNPNLKPERSYQADATLDFDADIFSGSFGIYENYINNYIYAAAKPGEQITELDEEGNPQDFDVYRYGQVNANLYGLEGSLNLHPAEFLHFDNTFSYTHAQNKTFNRPLALIPAGVIHNTLRFEPEVTGLKHFYISVGIDNFFKQSRIDPTFETAAGGYTLLNAGIGASFNVGKQTFKMAVSGNNLTDKRYYDALNRLRPGRLALTDPTFGVYNPGRNVTFSLYVPLNIN